MTDGQGVERLYHHQDMEWSGLNVFGQCFSWLVCILFISLQYLCHTHANAIINNFLWALCTVYNSERFCLISLNRTYVRIPLAYTVYTRVSIWMPVANRQREKKKR